MQYVAILGPYTLAYGMEFGCYSMVAVYTYKGEFQEVWDSGSATLAIVYMLQKFFMVFQNLFFSRGYVHPSSGFPELVHHYS